MTLSLTAGRPYSVDVLIDLITASTPEERRLAIGIHGSAGKPSAETCMGRSRARRATRGDAPGIRSRVTEHRSLRQFVAD